MPICSDIPGALQFLNEVQSRADATFTLREAVALLNGLF
jgi:hypothetical protein